jgi:hypothetical protein
MTKWQKNAAYTLALYALVVVMLRFSSGEGWQCAADRARPHPARLLDGLAAPAHERAGAGMGTPPVPAVAGGAAALRWLRQPDGQAYV